MHIVIAVNMDIGGPTSTVSGVTTKNNDKISSSDSCPDTNIGEAAATKDQKTGLVEYPSLYAAITRNYFPVNYLSLFFV